MKIQEKDQLASLRERMELNLTGLDSRMGDAQAALAERMEEAILKARKVKWKGFDYGESTWERITNLTNCASLLERISRRT